MKSKRALRRAVEIMLCAALFVALAYTAQSLKETGPDASAVKYLPSTILLLMVVVPIFLGKLFDVYIFSQPGRLDELNQMLTSDRIIRKWHAIEVLSWLAGSRFGSISWSRNKTEMQCHLWHQWLEENRSRLRWNETLERFIEVQDI